MDDADDDATDRTLRAELIDRIARSARGKYTLKLRTLMDFFGYRAVQRLRQSSLDAVITQLAGWGITAAFPGGTTATDWVTLSLSDTQPRATGGAEANSRPRPGDDVVELDPHANPPTFAFDIADTPERERSVAICHDIIAAVWSFRPVCLHVEASDEFFSSLGEAASTSCRTSLTTSSTTS
jgi:hypothetical protein